MFGNTKDGRNLSDRQSRVSRTAALAFGRLLVRRHDHNCGMTSPSISPAERVVPAGEFKTNCLRLMDEVQETGTVIVVTKHRRPVVRVSPFREEPPRLVGSCEGQLRIIGDIDSEPAIPADDWDMLAHPRA